MASEVLDPQEVEEAIKRLHRVLPPIYDSIAGAEAMEDPWTSRICLDLEWEGEKLTTVGLGNEKYVLQLDWTAITAFDREWITKWLMAAFRQVPVVIQNAAGDLKKLRANGFPVSGTADFLKLDDLMLAHAVLESEQFHDLEFLSAEHGRVGPYKFLRKVKDTEAQSLYNAADVVETALIWNHTIEPMLTKDPQAEYIYRCLSLPNMWMNIENEELGVAVHPEKPVILYEKYDAKRRDATRLATAYCGWPINLGSPDQMQHALYNLEGLPIQREKSARWEEEGKATSDKDALAALRRLQGTEWDEGESPTLEQAWLNIADGGHPLLEARYLFYGAQQSISHYIKPCLIVEGEGPKTKVIGARERIYPQCRLHVQASGRPSYVDPAVQQMKDDTDLGQMLVPDPGHVWIGFDWKQIEVRLLAELAQDMVYLDAFKRGEDIHEINIRALRPQKGSPEMEALLRRWVKAFVFRLHYRGLAENAGDIPGTRALGFDTPALVEASRRYLLLHPALPVYWREIEQEADRTGMVRTFMGRPRRLHGQFLAARNREASNHPMQGGVADIYLTTALAIKAAAPYTRLMFGRHDQQWWQCPVERELEFYLTMQPIVERDFMINEKPVSFPATFKVKRALA